MKKDKILVIGCGRLGASIATKLSDLGFDVVMLDKSDDSFRKLDDNFGGYTVVGDATDQFVLESDDLIHEVKEVIITTDSDNINLFISHLCFFVYDIPKIYVRFSDTSKAKLIEHTTIEAIYPFILSLEDFLKKRNGSTKS